MTRDRYKIYERGTPHFITCTTSGWLPVFSRQKPAEVVLESLKYLQENDSLNIFAYILMENHLHLVAAANDLPDIVKRFKSFTARNIIDYFIETGQIGFLEQLRQHKLEHKVDREFQLWQEGVHPELIRDSEMMRRKVEYIHNNPVRRGYVDDPLHWRYSSARNYAGKGGLLDVIIDWLY